MAKKKWKRYGNYVRIDDEMTWPMPRPAFEWVLRYSTPTREEILDAASILSAYEQMIADPERKRRHVIACIRAGQKEIP